MGWTARIWRRALVFTVLACLGFGKMAGTQFTPFNDRSRAMLEGSWLSCRAADGEYEERVYDGRWSGVQPFELHLGPYHDFALFQGIQDEHRDHNSADNLLRPHTVELRSNRANHQWEVAGLHFEVALAGGSHEDCESWFIRLLPQTSSH